ncbi:hypothetical protein DNTS_034741 [Danionella cerebrum]|uniref:Uncharacterized protein n=1 Tax=Danionella cerebrum TaxID=2873325 RepID=A0A553QKH6_9TELE|nr:hypothetical protein DNTS_034741 [Danionella translucida]
MRSGRFANPAPVGSDGTEALLAVSAAAEKDGGGGELGAVSAAATAASTGSNSKEHFQHSLIPVPSTISTSKACDLPPSCSSPSTHSSRLGTVCLPWERQDGQAAQPRGNDITGLLF